MAYASAWTEVGGEGGSVIHATCPDIAAACVDTAGVGTLSVESLSAYLSAQPQIPAGELGHIWCRIRSAAFESPKHEIELLDQLFQKYDKDKNGVISGNDMKRGFKHLKAMKPQLVPAALESLRIHFAAAEGGVDADAPVDYIRLVSWLNPVSSDGFGVKGVMV